MTFQAGQKSPALFRFDTGVVRGQLGTEKLAFGIHEVELGTTGQLLSGRYGLFNVYRVFSDGKRYGAAGWDWPHSALSNADGSVTVRCAAEPGRPFGLSGTYVWSDPRTLDLTIRVTAQRDLRDFEVFLASYFDASMTRALAYVQRHPQQPGRAGFLRATRPLGNWLMFPRDREAVGLIQDGRWKLPPHPVDWVILPELKFPLAVRRPATDGATVLLMAPRDDCFAIAMPYDTEPHYSVYLCLFGHDIAAGETATCRARLQVLGTPSEAALVEAYQRYQTSRSGDQ